MIWDAFSMVFTPHTLLLIAAGVTVGQILGAIPGLSGMMAIALVIPITYYMPAVPSLVLLIALSKGSLFGGTIPAILINTPGTPAAAATCIDGYQLAKQGKAIKALKVALLTSIIADVFSDSVLLVVAKPLSTLALKFGPADYAMLIIFSFTVIASVMGKSLIKGLISAIIGVLLGCIGSDPVVGIPRLTFGRIELFEGVPLIPMLIGMFAVAEVFRQFSDTTTRMEESFLPISKNPLDSKVNLSEMKRIGPHIFKGSLIGTFLGAMPGIGPTVSAFVSYGEAKRSSRPEVGIGKGAIEGLAAAEAGINSVCGANLIPLLTLGVPGDATAAVMLGAFMIHGMSPGPFLFERHLTEVYSFFIGLMIANVFNLVVGWFSISLSKKLCTLKKSTILPSILVFCVVGAFAVNMSIFDVTLMFVFGIFGFVLLELGIPVAPLVIGFVLQPIGESSIRRALVLSQGSYLPFFTRPFAIFFGILTVVSISFAIYQRRKSKHNELFLED